MTWTAGNISDPDPWRISDYGDAVITWNGT